MRQVGAFAFAPMSRWDMRYGDALVSRWREYQRTHAVAPQAQTFMEWFWQFPRRRGTREVQDWSRNVQVGCLEYLLRHNNFTTFSLGLLQLTLLQGGWKLERMQQGLQAEVDQLIKVQPPPRTVSRVDTASAVGDPLVAECRRRDQCRSIDPAEDTLLSYVEEFRPPKPQG